MTKELLQQALDALDKSIIFANSQGIGGWQPTVMACHEAKDAIKQALAQQEQPAQEPVTVLPDGSAFGVMSFPLPSDHWLYRDREYPTPESTETVDLPPPFVPRTIENLELIRLAAKWAIRAATDCGKENDFDPDAIVQNFVYATLGPYPQKIKDTAPTQPALSDERLAEIAKPFISAMGDHWCHEDGIRDNGAIEEFARAVIEAHCRGGCQAAKQGGRHASAN